MNDLRANSDPLTPLRATLAGRYEVLRELGQGAFATVYLARDLRHERQVAIKVLNVDPSSELPEMRFLREIRVLAGLQHPNILPLYDSGHVADRLYYVMPYVAGESLRDRIARERRLAIAPALRMTCELADALAYAHRCGVIHRDIKPENILLSGSHAILCDFGIARALDAVRFRQLTRTDGGSPGTPAYMSPEQLLGENVVDGRSDIYGLGCVLFEMLAGQPPFAGPSGFARRFTEPPPLVSSTRSDVPPGVDRLLTRALATDVTARLATADEFKEMLERVLKEIETRGSPEAAAPQITPMPAPSVSVIQRPELPSPAPYGGSDSGRSLRFRVTRERVAILSTILVLGAVVVARGVTEDPPPASELPLVVLVGESQNLAQDSLELRPNLLLHDAFSRWNDLRLVSTLRVSDAVARRGREPRTLDDAVDLAREVGAGRFVWARADRVRDSLEIRAALIELRGNEYRQGREHRKSISLAAADFRSPFAELASELLAADARQTSAAAVSTSSMAAWEAYDRAHQALAHWDVAAAERELRTAVQLDPDFPQPSLWLAQLMMWTGAAERMPAQWHAYATRAAERASALSAVEAAQARTIVAIAEARYPEACAEAASLVERDRLDFAAWYLLGECHRVDPVVVEDAASPSGWRFRTSFHTAIVAYRQAMELLPSLHFALGDLAVARLRRLLVSDISRMRRGVSATPDSLAFAGFPELSGDTLVFVPYRAHEISAGAVRSAPTLGDAVRRNRAILRDIAQRWVSAYPGSVTAREALAEAIEATGQIGDEQRGALAEVRAARVLASEPAQRLRLAAAEARLLLKLGRFRGARLKADSLLLAHPPGVASVDSVLDGLDGLTGRLGQATARLQSSGELETVHGPAGTFLHPPEPVARAGAAVLTHAALGAPPESVAVAAEHLDRMLESYVAPGARATTRASLLVRAIVVAFPPPSVDFVREADPNQGYVVRLRQLLLDGNPASLRRELAKWSQDRRDWPPGSVTIDATYAEAQLHLALGDTAHAAAHLDASLLALPTLRVGALSDVVEAGALVRSMALRAELARDKGDSDVARQWARAVTTLWSDADTELQPTVLAMREILAAPPR